MCITLVPRLRSLRCDLYIPGRFHEAESLFNLVLKVLPLEWRHGEKAVLGVASQKHIWEPWGESRKEWLYRTARQGGHSGPAPFMCVSWFWSPFPRCSGPAHSGLGELTSRFSLKLAAMGALPPWNSANGTIRGFLPRQLVVQHLPAHHCLRLRKRCNSH